MKGILASLLLIFSAPAIAMQAASTGLVYPDRIVLGDIVLQSFGKIECSGSDPRLRQIASSRVPTRILR